MLDGSTKLVVFAGRSTRLVVLAGRSMREVSYRQTKSTCDFKRLNDEFKRKIF